MNTEPVGVAGDRMKTKKPMLVVLPLAVAVLVGSLVLRILAGIAKGIWAILSCFAFRKLENGSEDRGIASALTMLAAFFGTTICSIVDATKVGHISIWTVAFGAALLWSAGPTIGHFVIKGLVYCFQAWRAALTKEIQRIQERE